jgi:hypothetical protein
MQPAAAWSRRLVAARPPRLQLLLRLWLMLRLQLQLLGRQWQLLQLWLARRGQRAGSSSCMAPSPAVVQRELHHVPPPSPSCQAP